ncbi:MAG: DedA family protein [Candidatus Peribacteria bacterium]|jgi:membrane-associated protein|nr:DedA family protein [Candidatus Peribacteria bacterium]
MLQVIKTLIDFVLHIDQHLELFITEYGILTYAILFGIIFIETGVVIMPFLPGDSLLFAAGALSAISDGLHIVLLRAIVFVAAVLGDTVNYEIGHYLGKKAFTRYPKIFKPHYLAKTEAFYEKYGPMTIIYARFVPIVRTFAPFIAGVGKMSYKKFISYNIIGGFARTSLFLRIGYFFGNLAFVQKYFSLIILAIIFISVCPLLIGRGIEQIKQIKKKKNAA